MIPDCLKLDRSGMESACRAAARSAFVGDAVIARTLTRYNLYCPPTNADLTPWMVLDGYWESWVTMAIGQAIRPGWRCLDIGASFGYYTLLMLDAVGPTGEVIAVEPHDECRRLLRRSVDGQFAGRPFFLFGCAVVGVDGPSVVEVSWPDHTLGGGIVAPGQGVIRPSQTIDRIMGGHPVNLIKMDIDGGELAAWDGMQTTLANNPDLILVMEWDPARYPDPAGFADRIAERFTLRTCGFDGKPVATTKAAMLAGGLDMLWLQR